MKVVAKVKNLSSKDMTPKCSLKQSVRYHAQGRTKHEERVISKIVDNVILPHEERTITCAMKIPADVSPTIRNCDIITMEYQLQV